MRLKTDLLIRADNPQALKLSILPPPPRDRKGKMTSSPTPVTWEEPEGRAGNPVASPWQEDFISQEEKLSVSEFK